MNDLPIESILPELREALERSPLVVLQAPPGAGKTTRVPLALLDAPWLAGGRQLMLEPRRIAARSAAHYMAGQLGETVGERVGYRVRFDSAIGKATRIEVVTEGILTRRLQREPELDGVGLLIFDEFHERHLDSDLALALARDIQAGLRDDLRILVMSATLDGEALAARLGAELVRSEGRSFPVTTHYLPRDPEGRVAHTVAAAVERALERDTGDILAFLPGVGEIRQCQSLLEERNADGGVQWLSLYGDLPLAEQQRIVAPDAGGGRRVILATNVAETSLTIDGIAVVIDSGWQRIPRFDPATGLTRLQRVRVSRAAATQRAGRAGRLGPGVCYRLWSEATQRGLLEQTRPEIVEADLAPLALDLAAWGVNTSSQLDWVDPPPVGAFSQAQELLGVLGAIDGVGRITRRGEAMSRLPLHPRLAYMVVEAQALGLASLACDIAALLSERDILVGEAGRDEVDIVYRLELLARHRQGGGRRGEVEGRRLKQLDRIARQWRRLLRVDASAEWHADDVGLLLAFAYPDRIARQRSGEVGRYLLSGGRGVRFVEGASLAGKSWLVAADISAEGRDGTIRRAAYLDIDRLLAITPAIIQTRQRVGWDGERVVAELEQWLGAIRYDSHPLSEADPAAVAEAWLDGIREQGLSLLGWTAAQQRFCERVTFLHHHLSSGDWPDLSERALLATLESWLLPYLDGIVNREQLRRLDLMTILKGVVGWQRLELLEQLAPERLVVPSGHARAIDYSNPAEPVLAVKLQELFGLIETPTLAGGAVAVTLHLLSPARRPIQITRDLKNFWRETYPEVKKELKGRYPKHPWPEDPYSAVATAATKRRH